MNDWSWFSDCAPNGIDKFPVGKGFGPDRVDHDVLITLPFLNSERGQVIDVDWLKLIRSVSEHSKQWKASEYPGDVIDKDVFLTEENCRSQDGIGNPRVFDSTL